MANRFASNLSSSDTSLWLHNKLGTSNDLWSDTTSIIGQLNNDVLNNIKDCFVDLQSQVKLKLLLSFLHISRRNVEQWKNELEEIIEVAIEDSDQWVSMLAELLKNYPQNGTINFQLETNSGSFNDLVIELKKLVRKHGDKGILPLECLYLNKNALTANVGQLAQPIKHFTLKRKPKSATLRAELLQKSTDAATGRRNSTGPSVPIRCRGLNSDSTPLKGIPSRNSFGLSQSSGFKTPSGLNKMGVTNKSRLSVGGGARGGIKLLDTNELPSSGRDAKRRKKAEKEEIDKQKEAEKAEAEPITPDYAAGLTSTIPPSPAPPSYAPPATPAPQPTVANENNSQISTPISTPMQNQPQMQTQNPSPAIAQQRLVLNEHTYGAQRPEPTPLKIEAKPVNVLPTVTQQHTQPTQMVTHITATPQLVQQLQATPTLIQMRQQPLQQTIQIQPQPLQQQQQQQPQMQIQPQQHPQQIQIHQTVQQIQQPVPNAQPQQPLVRRQLSLSREQMLAAQEMFNNSNRVTRPEKALILGFMAGSRENPCPQLGNVVTIKLNESEEDVRQPDQTIQRMIVETHFQMNYSTGEWRKVQKLRRLDQNVYQMQQFQTLQQTV